MKKITVLYLILLFILMVLPIKRVSAEYCATPAPYVPQKCYDTVTSEGPVGEDSQYYYIQKTTKQVEVPCSGESTDRFLYQAQVDSYNACLKRNVLKNTDNEPFKSSIKSDENTLIDRNKMCNNSFAINSIYNQVLGKCSCKDGYVTEFSNYSSPDFYDSIGPNMMNNDLICITKEEEQAVAESILKKNLPRDQKLYPDAGLTGLEKTSEEVSIKMKKSGSYLAYQKIKPLTANQIIKNINIIGNKQGSTLQDMQDYIDFLSKYQTIPKLTTKEYPAYPVSELVKKIKTHYPAYENQKDDIIIEIFTNSYPFLKDRVNFKTTNVPTKENITSTLSKEITQPSVNTETTNITIQSNKEPVKELKWYQKIFNWFMSK